MNETNHFAKLCNEIQEIMEIHLRQIFSNAFNINVQSQL
mgnify:FL=1